MTAPVFLSICAIAERRSFDKIEEAPVAGA